jgi:5'-nucleotidase
LLVLLTNDDGIDSEGFLALRERLLADRHDVYAIAPERERTCVAHAITLHKPLRIREVDSNLFSTSGTPVDCVFVAVKKLLPRKPDMVISGMNRGPNMGQDVTYSGTVAAAKEGAFLGVRSMAVSLAARTGFLYDDAVGVTSRILGSLSGAPSAGNVFLNINIPNVPRHEIKGFLVTRLGKRIYNDTVIERIDPRGGKYYWIGGDGESYEPLEGTDFVALENGYVSITPLCLDVTSLQSIKIYTKYFRRAL